jgi:hypothetical protein
MEFEKDLSNINIGKKTNFPQFTYHNILKVLKILSPRNLLPIKLHLTGSFFC